MPGALLRSGKLQEFKSLGEDGQPVYTSALQLREAIRLKLGRDASHCLAIPQRNETGDRIDWYAPEEGDVVPWSAATDDEQRQAKGQLQEMHAKLLTVGESMRGEQSRERQIFGRLLEKVIFFPDDTHVYLVNGKPVLTFWGFTDPHGSSADNPLGRLQPRAAQPVANAVSAVPSPAADPLPPPVVPVAKKRFPWWWLLLIPLLLLLLFFLLRSCAPEVPLPFIAPDVTEEPPVEEIRDGVRYDADGNVISSGVSESTATGEALPPAEGEQPAPDIQPEEVAPEESAPELQPEEPPVPEEQAAEESKQEEPKPEEPAPEEPLAEEPKPDEQPAPELQPEEPPAPEQKPQDQKSGEQQQPVPPQLQDQQPGQKPGGQQPQKPLEIPADAAQSGKTDFLNGKWKAGAGIQDARTGKPMRLDYDFKDGKGQVKISGDGVECVGDVNAAVGGSGLTIKNAGQAKCNDGSTYKLPNVTCKPGATSAADCTGQYDNSNKFPMSIKQGG